jgi:hypothetical protein
MDFNSQMLAFSKFGMDAIQQLFDDNAELFLSIDPKDATEKIVAVTRLHATKLRTPQSTDEMREILACILGGLLREGKLSINSYGLSALGKEEYNALVALPPPPVWEPEPSGPAVDFADVLDACRNTSIFNEKMRSDAFRERYQQAVAAGALESL